jgi:glycine/D-amino acid oxidase-like deaminating enzyme
MAEMDRHASPWLAEAGAAPAAAPLVGDAEADVAVVGAGFTGLSAALALRREGFDVALLEARTAGFGASGRNAGHLTPTIGKDIPTLLRLFGRERTGALLRLAETAIGHVENLIAKHGIDCDYERVGNVIAAVHERQFPAIDRAAGAAAAAGAAGQLLDRDALAQRGLPRAFARGFLEPRGGVLDPGRYVRGLRCAVLEAGARLHEHTPVTRIDEGDPAVVHTRDGRVRARHVVLGTNAWTPTLGWLRARAVPLHVQLFRTEPLSDAQLERVGWAGREGIYTAHEMLESYRLTADRRIVGGAKTVRYGFAGRMLPDVDAATARLLEKAFRARFPELGDVRVRDHWGGPIFVPIDFLPAVGRRGSVLYAAGYAGHGVAQASYAGEMLADLLLEREGPGQVLASRRGVPMPPEPLRWLVFQGLTRYFARIDRRADGVL